MLNFIAASAMALTFIALTFPAVAQVAAENDLNAAVALLLRGEVEDAIDAVRPHLATDARAVDLLFETGLATLGAAQATPPSEAGDREVLLDASIA